MRVIKTLGLTMATAIMAMALLGAGTASAEINLCKANETACAPANQYTFTEASPLTIEAENEGQGKLKDVTLFNTTEVSCQKELMKGKAEKKETQPGPEHIQQIIGQITEVKWEECAEVTAQEPLTKGEPCTVTPLQLPWTVHVTRPEPPTGDGTMYVGPHPVETGLQPGAKVECPHLGVTATFKAKQSQPEHPAEGKWLIASFTGGTPGKICINQEELKESLGLSTGYWTAQFKLINPSTAVFVTA